ncbi:MAG: hypothetical protein IKS45_03795 [Thermoguttaceae bacterium]|nr:hypothetical protein [Thermoguttaceae bacterium]
MTESEARAQVKKAKDKLYYLKKKLKDAYIPLNAARNELNNAQKKVNEADIEVRKAQARVADAERELREKEKYYNDSFGPNSNNKPKPKPDIDDHEPKGCFWYYVRAIILIVTLIGGILAILNHLHLL